MNTRPKQPSLYQRLKAIINGANVYIVTTQGNNRRLGSSLEQVQSALTGHIVRRATLTESLFYVAFGKK